MKKIKDKREFNDGKTSRAAVLRALFSISKDKDEFIGLYGSIEQFCVMALKDGVNKPKTEEQISHGAARAYNKVKAI